MFDNGHESPNLALLDDDLLSQVQTPCRPLPLQIQTMSNTTHAQAPEHTVDTGQPAGRTGKDGTLLTRLLTRPRNADCGCDGRRLPGALWKSVSPPTPSCRQRGLSLDQHGARAVGVHPQPTEEVSIHTTYIHTYVHTYILPSNRLIDMLNQKPMNQIRASTLYSMTEIFRSALERVQDSALAFDRR